MKTQNLYSLREGLEVIYDNSFSVSDDQIYLKKNELVSVKKLCELFCRNGAPYCVYNGYIVGYTIPQISKEFDLLRFSDDMIINIELKGELNQDIKGEKIVKQLKKNYYYLKFLDRQIKLFTFVENDGLYEYDQENDTLKKAQPQELISLLERQKTYENIDMNGVFKPSNYLISPFNKTESFLEGEYFLTNDQEMIKKQIMNNLNGTEYNFFCISANAGTGKTLLIYDVAKTVMKKGLRALILHSGYLNNGHFKLKNGFGWDIYAVKDIEDYGQELFNGKALIIVDEAQRTRKYQLDFIIKTAIEKNIPVIFSYDTNQYLAEGENRDANEYLAQNYGEYKIFYKELTDKIRTNKDMASFIKNLLCVGSSKRNLDYKNVTLEYFDSLDQVKEYINYISTEKGWQAITYTNSLSYHEKIDRLAEITNVNAHYVIGQEFDKVVLVMDENFNYDDSGNLCFKNTHYSLRGMFYQIVTRVVNELKIVVLDNPKLYGRLLDIKDMKQSLNKKENRE